MEYSTGESGIKSLAGFAYQIKVFTYYLANLKKEEQIEFETLEDVNIKTFKTEEIDKKSENYKCILQTKEENIAIQVKRTTISNSVAEKILYNWLIVEKSHKNINNYILFTDEEYKNRDVIFNIDAKKVFNKVKESNSKSNALITIVKNIFKDDFEEFNKIYNLIKNKYKFKSLANIDDEILNSYEELFRKEAISDSIYYMRIQELMRYITMEIMKAVSNKKPFILTYSKFIKQIEEICNNIEEDKVIISYSLFKSNHKINWDELGIVKSRECKQLKACELSKRLIEQHLMYKLYYESLRLSYMENNKIQKIDDIEDTTYDNYDFAISLLKRKNEDIPINRLNETKERSNSYAQNEQIRYGAAIYLTRDDIEMEKQISWKEMQEVEE